jgi:hypothetical protein
LIKFEGIDGCSGGEVIIFSDIKGGGGGGG